MTEENKKFLNENFSRLGDGCFIESKLLNALEGIRVRSLFRDLQESDKTKFNFVLGEDSIRIWNCESLVKEVQCRVPFGITNLKFQALKNGSDVFIFRTAFYAPFISETADNSKEENQNS